MDAGTAEEGPQQDQEPLCSAAVSAPEAGGHVRTIPPYDGGADGGDEEEGEDEDEDDDDDDSSSEDEDIELDAKTAQKMMKLEEQLRANPADYEKHIEYIQLLRDAKLRARLREAHEALSSRFPLSADLWLAWINDELEAVSGAEDVTRVLGLLQRATEEYLSVDVWALYLQIGRDFDPEVQALTPAGVERHRALCEAALAKAGLHIAEAPKLWEHYRKFELEVEAGGGGGKQQEERVRALFQRQLQVPLSDHAATLEEYKAWEVQHGKAAPPHVLKAAEKAAQALELRSGSEASVAPELAADVAKLGAFLSYIKLEMLQGDPSRVQCVYERAIAQFPLTHSLWLQYGQYLESNKMPSPANAVYGRAVRNCPWVGAVWERAIRAMDRSGGKEEQAHAMYEKALAAGLQSEEDFLCVALAWLDLLRHAADCADETQRLADAEAAGLALRAGFRSVSEALMSRYPTSLDRTLLLPGYWAHCELHVLKDVQAAREVWEATLKGSLGRYAEAWEAYAAMERAQRNIKQARAVYKRCYSRRLEEGGQLAVCHAWLRFEREEGSAEDYLQAQLKSEPILEEAAAVAAAAADAAAAAAAKAAVQKAPKLSKEEVKALRQQADPHFKKDKAKAGKEGTTAGATPPKRGRSAGEEPQEDVGTGAKRARTGEAPAAAEPGAAHVADAGPCGAGTAAADGDTDMADQDAAAERNGSEAGTAGHTEQAEPARYTDEQTVFAKGLRPAVREEELHKFLKQHLGDGVKAVRMPRDPATGQSRGFAYIECASAEALQKAVELNGCSFQGKVLFLAESKPPGAAGGGRGGGGRGRSGPFPAGGRHGGGRGGRGFGGGWEGDAQAGDGGGFGGGGRGGRGGGGGFHRGLGYQAVPPSGGRGGTGHMRMHLDVGGEGAPASRSAPLVPRSVQLAQAGGGGAPPSGGQPLSNDEFRKMLLKK